MRHVPGVNSRFVVVPDSGYFGVFDRVSGLTLVHRESLTIAENIVRHLESGPAGDDYTESTEVARSIRAWL